MNGKKVILIAAGVGGGLWLLNYVTTKLDTINKLSAQVVGLQFGQLLFPSLNVTVSVRVTNASTADATANAFTGTLYAADGVTQLGTFNVLFNTQQGVLIPANGSAVIDVNANINLISAATILLANAKTVVLDATVTINNIPIPLKQDVAIGCACDN